MAQFESGDIFINNYNLRRLGFECCTINANTDRLFGINRNIETEIGLNNEEYFVGMKNTRPTIDVELVKRDKYGNIISITDDDFDELARILFQNEICYIDNEGLKYYGSFIDGTSWRNSANQGYVILKFELVSPYAYTKSRNDNIHCDTTEIITFNNQSNISKYTYLDVDVKNLATTTSIITFENLTTGEVIKIKNIESNECIRILSEEKEVFSLTNPNKNMFPNIEYDRHFLRLCYGVNRVKITGKCKCSFRHIARKLIV